MLLEYHCSWTGKQRDYNMPPFFKKKVWKVSAIFIILCFSYEKSTICLQLTPLIIYKGYNTLNKDSLAFRGYLMMVLIRKKVIKHFKIAAFLSKYGENVKGRIKY